MVFGGLMLAITVVGIRVAEPVLRGYMGQTAADTVTCIIIYIFTTPFIGPLMNLHNNLFTALWLRKKSFAYCIEPDKGRRSDKYRYGTSCGFV